MTAPTVSSLPDWCPELRLRRLWRSEIQAKGHSTCREQALSLCVFPRNYTIGLYPRTLYFQRQNGGRVSPRIPPSCSSPVFASLGLLGNRASKFWRNSAYNEGERGKNVSYGKGKVWTTKSRRSHSFIARWSQFLDSSYLHMPKWSSGA